MSADDKCKRNILVTGGAGFIGTHLVAKLLEMDYCGSITIFDDFSVGKKDNVLALQSATKKVRIVSGDIRDGVALDSVLEGIDTVYHLAAVVGVDRVLALPEDTWDVEVNGTRNLLEKCFEHKVRRFFLASSSECYGCYDISKAAMRESDQIRPNTYYGEAKLECEKMCNRYSAEGKISCVAARYFNVYGPGQSFNGYVIPNMLDSAIKGRPIKIYGHGNQVRDFMYIEDAIDATIKLGDSGCVGVYNIGSGHATSINDLAKMVIDITGSKSGIISVPIRRPTDIESKLCDNAKIRQAIGWEPKNDVRNGLEKIISSLKNDPSLEKCLIPESQKTPCNPND